MDISTKQEGKIEIHVADNGTVFRKSIDKNLQPSSPPKPTGE